MKRLLFTNYIRLRRFIASNRQRFLAEVLLAMLTWYVTYSLNRQTLANCQDERAVLLAEKVTHQELVDSLRWSARLEGKEAVIRELKRENLLLRDELTRKLLSADSSRQNAPITD